MRWKLTIIIASIIIVANSICVFAQEEAVENLGDGIISVRYEKESGKAIKIMVEKSGIRFFYDLDDDNESLLPLQSGDGIYRICILEQERDNQYRVLLSKSLEYIAIHKNECFTNPIDIIYWEEGEAIYKKAIELTDGKKTDHEKITAIYNFTINSFDYDYDKIKNIDVNYLPSPNHMMSSKKGICYDYASAFAAMLRINGIPTRLVKGHIKGVDAYHAWNEVYDSSSQRWITVDTSFDAYYIDKGLDYSFEKKQENYIAEQIF